MNRMEEYNDLIKETGTLPPALLDTVFHARVREKKAKRTRRLFAIPGSGLAIFLITFVLLVNVSTTFALACSRIPFLRELAAFVSLSPSLSAAVENDYVQLIGLEQTENGITMKIEYLIVDQKQLNIFYTLSSQVYSSVMVTPEISAADGSEIDGFTIWSSGRETPNEGLHSITVDFVSAGDDMPDGLILSCAVDNYGSNTEDFAAPASADHSALVERPEPKTVAEFTFTLRFDTTFTQRGEVIDVDQSFTLDGQRLTVTTIEVYPTHIRLNVTGDESNTAWLKSLLCRLEDEDGNKYEQTCYGIIATGAVSSPMTNSFRLESTFFSGSSDLTLYITGAVWLDKDMERIKIDLAGGRADRLPEGVALVESIQTSDGWRLTFSGRRREDMSAYQLILSQYYDETDGEYWINSWQSTAADYWDEAEQRYVENPGRFEEQFTLEGYPYDVVYLSPSFSHTTRLDAPIMIKIK